MTGNPESDVTILGRSLMKETILVLGSEPTIRNAIRDALQGAGYFVITAQNVSVAEQRSKECRPDLLIVRHYTEYMGGHEAAVYLRRSLPGIPVLILGGILDHPDLEVRASAYGFEIFPQPYPAAELIAKVRETLLKAPRREAPPHGSERAGE
jgi:DNA-binding response OmpR family regulator